MMTTATTAQIEMLKWLINARHSGGRIGIYEYEYNIVIQQTETGAMSLCQIRLVRKIRQM